MLLAVKQYQACSLQVSRNCKRRLRIYILNLKPTLSTFADEVGFPPPGFPGSCVSLCKGIKTDLPVFVRTDTLVSTGNMELKSGIQSFNLSRFLIQYIQYNILHDTCKKIYVILQYNTI